ncbi:hypothetical protein Tco_1143934, partial [Tanacetum coccineum]
IILKDIYNTFYKDEAKLAKESIDLVDALEKGKSKLMVSEKGSKKASVDLVDALDLQNRLKKLSKDFNMLVKAQKTKEAKEAKVVLGLKDFLMFLKLLLLRTPWCIKGGDMDSESAHMVAASKVPMLKPGEFEIWRMRIKQYIQVIDYALWEIIENGNTAPKTTVVKGVEKVIPPTTAEEKAQKRLEVKARSTLMMGIPIEHQLKFNSIKDAKLLLKAIEKSSKTLDQTFDRLQKLVSQLEILGETLLQEDVNQKLLRSLLPEWKTHDVVWRNKPELETMSIDDLYNNLKVYEPEVKGTSSSNTSTQNMAFVSSNNSDSTNEAVNTTNGVSAASTQVSAANCNTPKLGRNGIWVGGGTS